MNPLAAPFTRIVLRYGVGAAVALGLSEGMAETLVADPDVILIVSALVAVAVEGVYAYARKTGGVT